MSDDTEIVFCGGNAQPTDLHLLSRVVAKDDGIIEYLAARDRRKAGKLAHLMEQQQDRRDDRGT